MKSFYIYLNTEDMNLYDYVMHTYLSRFDNSEESKRLLKKYLDNCNAKYIRVKQFVEEYSLNGRGIMGVIGKLSDETIQEELAEFGLKCYNERLLNEMNKENVKAL